MRGMQVCYHGQTDALVFIYRSCSQERGDHTLIIGPPILGELEAVLIETCGWASDRAPAVRAELDAIAEVVTPVRPTHLPGS